MATSVILADDHKVVRQGLRLLLSAEAQIRLIGEAGTGLEAVALVQRLRPDVLVLDLMMPELNGLEVTRQVVQLSPHTRVLILSMHADEAYVREALKNGAAGYVLKDASAEELIGAVHAVAAGQRYLSSPLSERAVQSYIERAEETTLDLYETLTTREREVLQLAAEGHTSAQIANRLFISPRTAETHRANLMRKLGLSGQTELVRFALRRGLVEMNA